MMTASVDRPRSEQRRSRLSARHVGWDTGYRRLTPAAERNRESLQAEVEFIQHDARAQVPVA